MTFNFLNYLELSKKIANDPSYHAESAKRTAISRAYFSVFNHIKLKNSQFKFPKAPEAHKLLCNLLKDVKREWKIANKLEDLRVKRNRADYEGDANPDDDLEESLRLAEELSKY